MSIGHAQTPDVNAVRSSVHVCENERIIVVQHWVEELKRLVPIK